MKTKTIAILILLVAVIGLVALVFRPAKTVDLLQRYPTTLTTGLLDPSQALPWQFASADVFQLSRFDLAVGDQLKVQTGSAELGIGACADGAVWAVVIPTQSGQLTSPATGSSEAVASIWLRFHPKEIDRLFPPDSVSPASDDTGSVVSQMRRIAAVKFRASYHAGMNAMIPAPKDMTVDVDTKNGVRRFFMVDRQAGTAKYVSALENHPVSLAAAPARFSSGAEGASGAPRVIATVPANGANDVDPALGEITVTFDQDMGQGMSWTGARAEFPPSFPGARAYWRDSRTCILPVRLQPGHHYRVGINSSSHRNFRSASGQPAQLSAINFTTR